MRGGSNSEEWSSSGLVHSVACDLELCQDLLCDLRALQGASVRRIETAGRKPAGDAGLQSKVQALSKQLQQERQEREDLLAQHEVLRDMLRKSYGQVVDELLTATQALRCKERQLAHLMGKPSSSDLNDMDRPAVHPTIVPATHTGKPTVRLLKVQGHISPAPRAFEQQSRQEQVHSGPQAHQPLDPGVAARVPRQQRNSGVPAQQQTDQQHTATSQPEPSGSNTTGSPASTPPSNWPFTTPATPPGPDPWSQLQRATEALSRLYQPQDPSAPQPQPPATGACQSLFQEELQPGRKVEASSAFPFFYARQASHASSLSPSPQQHGMASTSTAILLDGTGASAPVNSGPAQPSGPWASYLAGQASGRRWRHSEEPTALGAAGTPASCSTILPGYFDEDSRTGHDGRVSSSSSEGSPWRAPDRRPSDPMQQSSSAWADDEGVAPEYFAEHVSQAAHLPAVSRRWPGGSHGGSTVHRASSGRLVPDRATSAPGGPSLPIGQAAVSHPASAVGQAAAVTGSMADFLGGAQMQGLDIPPGSQMLPPPRQGYPPASQLPIGDSESSSDKLFKAIQGQLHSLQTAFQTDFEDKGVAKGPGLARRVQQAETHDGTPNSELQWPAGAPVAAGSGMGAAQYAMQSQEGQATGNLHAGFVVIGMGAA